MKKILISGPAAGGEEYLEAQARCLDGSGRFLEWARSPKNTVEAPEPNP